MMQLPRAPLVTAIGLPRSWEIALLDGSEEGVHVDVEDGARPSERAVIHAGLVVRALAVDSEGIRFSIECFRDAGKRQILNSLISNE